jgi:HPt (histidine-containing phosphotransfer) domain-containing protein
MTDDRMETLGNRFALRCRTHLEELRRFRTGELPLGGEGEAFHLLVHSLAGTAGMFGFEEAGNRAAEVETAFLATPADTGVVMRRLDALIADIEKIASSAER